MDAAIRQSLRELQTTDNLSGFGKILGHYIVIGIAVALAKLSFWLYPVALLLIGSRLRALDNLSHEAFHNQVFKSSFLNDWITSIFCAFPVHISIGVLRKIHREHHVHIGDSERDPNLPKYAHLPLPRHQRNWHLFRVLSGAYQFRKSLNAYAQSFLSPASRVELVARILFWLTIILLVSAVGLWQDFLLFYVVPLLTTYAAIRQLVNMSEHMLDTSVPYFTRNIMCHPILQFLMFPHADHLHLIHHLNSAIPGSRLRTAHQLLLADPEYAYLPSFEGYFFGENSFLAWAFQDIESQPLSQAISVKA
ncbi:hypothetical protein C1752_09749 [Acaryochloris thomasi RCC1774]|uniref:Fatty acid desaturase domain-containing protein n=1 Tax=Acaryochloris thomasi RCC1774 TaxID=1764569 RepID=A0A2W1J9J1_9CYAN|nr:fatty acid desaturase [Acaryochloris thomasi]PZD70728.1 hypothetical protein C1752_09749 [Acaryochloris thomasi RCC1774]